MYEQDVVLLKIFKKVIFVENICGEGEVFLNFSHHWNSSGVSIIKGAAIDRDILVRHEDSYCL